MTVRIHEADGTPYEHVLDIQSTYKKYDVPFNTKYKRVRRNTKRFIARQQAAALAAQGDTEAAEAIGMIDVGFGLDVWEDAKERENWKVADWTEEEEQMMAGATYEWIRMDADFEWITTIDFQQPDFMWVSQLQRDRDVVAQLEVCLFAAWCGHGSHILSSGHTSACEAAADRNRLWHVHENGARHELLPPHPCRGGVGARHCMLERSPYGQCTDQTAPSARPASSGSLGYSISSRYSFAIVIRLRPRTRIYSLTNMSRFRMTSLTSPSISFARRVPMTVMPKDVHAHDYPGSSNRHLASSL